MGAHAPFKCSVKSRSEKAENEFGNNNDQYDTYDKRPHVDDGLSDLIDTKIEIKIRGNVKQNEYQDQKYGKLDEYVFYKLPGLGLHNFTSFDGIDCVVIYMFMCNNIFI